MKAIIVYYSLEGNTEFIANVIKNEIGAEVLELKPKKEYATKGFKKYFWGGRSVMLKETPELVEYSFAPADYDLIIFGTPVWAGSFAPPLLTFLSENAIDSKKVAIFACHGSGGASGCFKKLKECIPDNEFISEIAFFDPIKKQTEMNKNLAIEWAKGLK